MLWLVGRVHKYWSELHCHLLLCAWRCPPTSMTRARQATKDAGTISGLNVPVINEPLLLTVSTMGSRRAKRSSPLDLGGGSLFGLMIVFKTRLHTAVANGRRNLCQDERSHGISEKRGVLVTRCYSGGINIIQGEALVTLVMWSVNYMLRY